MKQQENSDFAYIKTPVNLMLACDAHTFKLFSILQQQESFFKAKKEIKNGYFSISIETLILFSGLKRNQLNECLQTLNNNNIIDIIQSPKGTKIKNKYKILWETIEKLNNVSFNDIVFLDEHKIEKIKRPKKEKEHKTESRKNNFNFNNQERKVA